MAIIVDPNPNLMSADSWALVSGGMVINTIIDTTQDMNTSPILQAYDYVVDMTMQGQNAGIGWTYNSTGNQFTPPPQPPINWSDVVQGDFDGIAQGLIQVVFDSGSQGGALTTQQITAAFNAAIEDTQSGFTPNQMQLMNTILSYVQSGG